MGQGISPTRIQAHGSGVQCISCQILPVVRYSGQASRSLQTYVKWVLSDAQMTGTIVTPAGSWSWVFHHQSPVSSSLYILRLSESVGRTSPKSKCSWNGRCAKWNWIDLKSLYIMIFRRYMNDLQFNYQCRARNRVERGSFAGYLVFAMNRFWIVQSMPEILLNPHCRLLDTWLSLLKVVYWLKSMPWIPLFCILAMLVVQSSCFAICFPLRVFDSNYLPMSVRLCFIRGTCQIRHPGVYSFFVGSISRRWLTTHIVYG